MKAKKHAVRVKEEHKERLRQTAERKNDTMTNLIRQQLKVLLEQHGLPTL